MLFAEVLVVALAYTAANLVAIWAGLSRQHWLLRFSVLGVVLTPLLVLPDNDLGTNLVTAAKWYVAMAAVTVLLIGSRAIAQAIANRKLPPLRFRLREVLLTVAFICGLFGIASWLPGYALSSLWSTSSLVSLCCSLTAAIAAWSALSTRPIWLRFSVLVTMTLLVALPVPLFSLGKWYGSVIENDWQRYASVCLPAFFIAGYLSLWRFYFAVSGSIDENRKLQWSVSAAMALVAFAILAPLGLVYYEMVKPISVPDQEAPEPNGYELLLAAGGAIDNEIWRIHEKVNAGTEELRFAVESIKPAFELADSALSTSSLVTLDYTDMEFNSSVDDTSRIRELARAYEVRARLAIKEGRTAEAVRIYLDLIEMAYQFETGGLIIHRLTAVFILGMGIDGLNRLAPSMLPPDCRHAISRLTFYDTRREPIEAFLERERLFHRLAYGWVGRWGALFGDLRNLEDDSLVKLDKLYVARVRVLTVDLAVQLHNRENAGLPNDLVDLIPEYLGRIPSDPFDGESIRYRRRKGGYMIQTVGFQDRDDVDRRRRGLLVERYVDEFDETK